MRTSDANSQNKIRCRPFILQGTMLRDELHILNTDFVFDRSRQYPSYGHFAPIPHGRPGIPPQRPLPGPGSGVGGGGGRVHAMQAPATLRRLRGDRLVGLDRVAAGLQRLLLQRLVPLPAGPEHEAHQPRDRAIHHQRPETDQERGDAVLRARQALLHQLALFRRRRECGTQAVQRHGGGELRLPLTALFSPSYPHPEWHCIICK